MKLQCILHVSFILPAAGCLPHRGDAYTTTLDLTAARESAEADRLWNAAQDTLRDYRFRLDRIDRQEGVITTLPLGSKHFFEVWRKDVATREDFWEATVNPLRRWVEVRFTGGEDSAGTRLAVVVHRERLSTPERQFNNTVGTYQYFSSAAPTITGDGRATGGTEQWTDLGRDAALEQQLLERIVERAGAASPEADG